MAKSKPKATRPKAAPAARAAERTSRREGRSPAAAPRKDAARGANGAPRTAAAPTRAASAARVRSDAAPVHAVRAATPTRNLRRGRTASDVSSADPLLFAPLSEGERADAIRCLLEDDRLRGLAKVGRYRVITAEPLVVKPPAPLAGRRLARVVVYDYASDRCVDACVDLDRGAVCHVSTSTAQPMLSRDEEADAIAIADADQRVVEARGIAATATAALHYWSLRETELAFRRRSVAVVYAAPGARPSCVAVVSLIDREVVAVVPAEQW